MSPRKLPPKPPRLSAKEKKQLQDAILEKDERQKIKNISSVAFQVENIQRQSARNIKNIENKIGGVASRLTAGTNKQIIEVRKYGDTAGVREVTKSVTKILDKLGLTIEALSRGIGAITLATARATKDAVQQYGRAISEDISVNKQNVIAMSLARTSPIFGYFVAKIFETDIFRNFLNRLKEKFSGIFSKIKGARRAREEGTESPFFEEEGSPIATSAIAAGRARRRRRTKVVAEGVGVRRTAVPGDIQSIVINVSKSISKGFSDLSQTITEAKDNIEELFTKSVTQSKKQLDAIISILSGRFKLRASSVLYRIDQNLLKLRLAVIGDESPYNSIFDEFLSQHKTLQKMYLAFSKIHKAVLFPFKLFFKVRGGYRSDIPRGPNVFQNIADILAVTYTTEMHKLDVIIEYLGDIGYGITGLSFRKPEEIKEKGTYTIFGKLKEFFESMKGGKEGVKGYIKKKMKKTPEELIDAFAKFYDLDADAMKEAYKMLPERVKERGRKVHEKVTGGVEKVAEGVRKTYERIRPVGEKGARRTYEAVKSAKDTTLNFLRRIYNTLVIRRSPIRTISEVMYDLHHTFISIKKDTKTIATTSKLDRLKEKKEDTKKGLYEKLQNAKEKAQAAVKRGKQIWQWIVMAGMMLLNVLKGIFGPVINIIQKLFSGGGALKGLLGGARGLGAAAGAAYGVYSTATGAIEGVKHAREWHGKKEGEKVSTSEKVTAGIGGALGGTKSGVSGALAGAAKGAGIGMAVGMVFPPAAPFAAIIGAVAGAILGAVGGKNIAKALQWSWNKIKSIGVAIWEGIKYPFVLVRDLFLKVKDWIGEKVSSIPDLFKSGLLAIWNSFKSFGSSLVEVGTNIKEWLIEKIGSIPVVGPILLKAMRAAAKGLKTVYEAAKEAPETIAAGAAKVKETAVRGGEAIAGGVAAAAKEVKEKGVVGAVGGVVGKAISKVAGIQIKPDVDTTGVKEPVWKNFTAMAEENKTKTGQDLVLNSAFRSREKQAELHKANPAVAAPPGHSLHETGKALDINSVGANQLAKSGLMEKYGFYRPMSYEPWHLQMKSEVGDRVPSSPLSRTQLTAMMAESESRPISAMLEANKNLQESVSSGLNKVSNNVNASTNTISNVVNTTMSSMNQGGQNRRQELDPALEAILSADLS